MTFIKCYRSIEAWELLQANKNAFILLWVVASRACRGSSGNPRNLRVGEALLGDHSSYGMSRAQYRAAIKSLKRMGYLTTKTTSKGTTATLINTSIFDPNLETQNRAATSNTTNKPYKKRPYLTTNKNYNKKNTKYENIGRVL